MGDKCGRQVWETSVGETQCGRQVWETSVNSCAPRHPKWETSVGDKCKLMRPKGPGVGEGDKCKFMRPKEPRVGDKCGRQVWATSVNSCGPRNPEWE